MDLVMSGCEVPVFGDWRGCHGRWGWFGKLATGTNLPGTGVSLAGIQG